METKSKLLDPRKVDLSQVGSAIGLILVVIVASVITQGSFLSASNLTNIFRQVTIGSIGVDYVTFHRSATPFCHRVAAAIHGAGMKAGIALNPSETPEDLLPVLPYVELVLVMSIEPGFSGQAFIPHSLDTVAQLDRMRRERGLDFVISVDGGIDAATGRALKEAGANWLVLGYPAIFRQPDGIEHSFRRFYRAVEGCEPAFKE